MNQTVTINREAGDKLKGPRLQKLRCVSLVLDAIEKSVKPHIYAAVEHKEDVYINNIGEGTEYLEQDKNYDVGSKFTFNSPEVTNCMVSFCDMWVEYVVKSKDVYLGFYSTNEIGKEKTTQTITALNIDLPDEPILELLQNKIFDDSKLIPAVKALVIAEYRKQYDDDNPGYVGTLENFTNDDWKKLLSAIDWKFGESAEEELQAIVLEKIKKCKFFNYTFLGKEETILRNLMDLLDERQCVTDLLGKFVNSSDVQLEFMKITSVIDDKTDDPIYKIWESLPEPVDKRNILDKIKAVCSAPNERRLQMYARRTASSRILQDDKVNDKSFSSLRYRVYEKCEEELGTYLKNLPSGALGDLDEIDKLFAFLYKVAISHANIMAGDFKYSLRSKPIIEGIVLELFDSCYLAMN
jgi:hypothetical protein